MCSLYIQMCLVCFECLLHTKRCTIKICVNWCKLRTHMFMKMKKRMSGIIIYYSCYECCFWHSYSQLQQQRKNDTKNVKREIEIARDRVNTKKIIWNINKTKSTQQLLLQSHNYYTNYYVLCALCSVHTFSLLTFIASTIQTARRDCIQFDVYVEFPFIYKFRIAFEFKFI